MPLRRTVPAGALRALPVSLATLLLGACTSEARFEEDFIVSQCALLLECQGETLALFDDAASCEAQYADWYGAWTEGCAYDPYAARDCLRAVEEAACDDRDGVGLECDPVWTGSCPWSE